MYAILLTGQALKDKEKLRQAKLTGNAKQLIDLLKTDPYPNPPPYEKLVGNLNGLYSRRINIRHRLVYQVIEPEKIVKILRMWTHYD